MTALLEREIAFVTALREGGLTVSVAESLDAVRVTRTLGLADRERLRAGLAATLVKRQAHRPVFDTLFDLFFPSRTGGATPDGGTVGARRVARDDPRRETVRTLVADYLREGSPELLDAAAREAVDVFGAVPDGSSGRPTWSRYAVTSAVSARTLLAALLDEVLAGAPRGGPAERRARMLIERRHANFERAVATEVNRRLAERSDPATVARTATPVGIDRVAFLGANREQLAALRRELEPLARRLAARLAQDRRRGSRGALDVRATMREALSSGGVPMALRQRPRRPVKTDLVVLCDLSGSVSSFAHFTLLLVYALRQQFARVRAFGFVDELDEITRFFRPGDDLFETVSGLTERADVVGPTGRTDYGAAFALFARRFPDAVGSRTSLLVLGDARSNHGPLGLDRLQPLADRARHAYWLNPERQRLWDTGDSRASEFARVVPMVECRDLAQLSGFVRELSR